MKALQEDQIRETREKISLELLNAYENLAAIHLTATSLVNTKSISEASNFTLNNAIQTSGSCGGALIMPWNDRPEIFASINAGSEVELYALKKAGADLSKPRYEDGIKQAVSDSSGRFVKNTLSIPLMFGQSKEGLLFLFSTDEKKYTGVDVKVMSVLASQGALAIKNLIHMTELEQNNQRLIDTLAQLTSTQNELVRSERLSALGEMASMIVHDIKSPMGGLLGYAQLIHATVDMLSANEIKEYSGVIIKEMRRLSNLTEEIMEFSRGVDRDLNLREMEPLDLINTAWPLIESELMNHNMKAVHLKKDLQSKVLVDSDRMERVFINLAVNARQAMEGGGRLTVDARQSGSWIEISFKDTGKGVPKEIRNKIFQPFMTRKKGSSLGLGLAMSQWITEAHGGSLLMADTGDEGTEMVVRLPGLCKS